VKTLILYATKYGSTEKAAQLLATLLPGEATMADLSKSPAPDLSGFDAVVIGSAVYVGKIMQPAQMYLEENADTLRGKTLGLFTCCANVELADEQLKTNFPESLRHAARATGHFGYAIQMSKMNFIERTAIKVIMKTRESSENILEANIQQFAATLSS
jgi:menaquinone-dependent protoporphyrinogen oxidase